MCYCFPFKIITNPPPSQGMSDNPPAQVRKVAKKAPIPPGTIRVSITFKIGYGWRGTKSRDFPGRHFNRVDGDLIQEWAREFRGGDSLFPAVPDKRFIALPHLSGAATRRKPFLGIDAVHRRDAYHWFRSSQERLSKFSPPVLTRPHPTPFIKRDAPSLEICI